MKQKSPEIEPNKYRHLIYKNDSVSDRWWQREDSVGIRVPISNLPWDPYHCIYQAEFQMESKDLNVESRDINVIEEK